MENDRHLVWGCREGQEGLMALKLTVWWVEAGEPGFRSRSLRIPGHREDGPTSAGGGNLNSK